MLCLLAVCDCHMAMLSVSRYESKTEGGSVTKETLLDENDDVWRSLRHQHIAVASQYVLFCSFTVCII